MNTKNFLLTFILLTSSQIGLCVDNELSKLLSGLASEKKTDLYSSQSLIQSIDLKVQSKEDSEKNDISLKMDISNITQIKAGSKIKKNQKERLEFIATIETAEKAESIYKSYISVVHGDIKAKLLKRMSIVLNDQAKVAGEYLQRGQLEVDDFLKIQKEYVQNSVDKTEARNITNASLDMLQSLTDSKVSRTSLKGKNLDALMYFLKKNIETKKKQPELSSLRFIELEREKSNLEWQLDKAHSSRILDNIEFGVEVDRSQGLEDEEESRIFVNLNFNLLDSSRANGKMNERYLSKLKADASARIERDKELEEYTAIKLSMKAKLKQWVMLKKSNAKRRINSTLRAYRNNKGVSPLKKLSLKKSLITLSLEDIKLKEEILYSYLELLKKRGYLQTNATKNYFDKYFIKKAVL